MNGISVSKRKAKASRYEHMPMEDAQRSSYEDGWNAALIAVLAIEAHTAYCIDRMAVEELTRGEAR